MKKTCMNCRNYHAVLMDNAMALLNILQKQERQTPLTTIKVGDWVC